jgi:hypothetical protein
MECSELPKEEELRKLSSEELLELYGLLIRLRIRHVKYDEWFDYLSCGNVCKKLILERMR